MPQVYFPQLIEQISDNPDQEIAWRTPLRDKVSITEDLSHRSNPASGDLTNKTWTLVYTNLGIADAPATVSGIQLDLVTQRNGRITDNTIQLTYQGQAIGKNNFSYVTDVEGHLKLVNENTYGGADDLWGAEITPEMLQDPSFGVILKFQSHPYYPHKCGMSVETVSVTVY